MIGVIHRFPVWLPQTQTWMYNQVRYLPRDIEAHIVCNRTENLDQFAVPNIHCLADAPKWRFGLNTGLRKLRLRRFSGFALGVARDSHAGILHSHFGNIGWADMALARRAGLKHVVTFYGMDVNFLPRCQPAWKARYRALFRAVDLVLCEGPHMAQCVRDMGCAEQKVQVHRLGIAIDQIEYSPMEWRPGQPLKILIASSFREKKGIPYALDALGLLQQGIPLAITLVGDAGHDPREVTEKKVIMDRIENLDFGEKIRLLGFQPHARLLAEARQHHIFLSPSVTAGDGDTEGGAPVSIIEMSAVGMMVVSTTHCDIPQVVKHRETGMLSGERDVDGLVRNLKWLLDNPSEWAAMRTAARNQMETKFDAQSQGERLSSIYKGLMEQFA